MASKLKKASEEQKEFLINFMESNLAFSQDKFEGVDGAHVRNEKWKELSEQLNCLGGAVKDPQKWRKFWADHKSHVKEKEALLKASFQRSGVNGPQKMKPLSELEGRVLQLMVPALIEGNDSVEELFTVEESMVEEYLDESQGQNFLTTVPTQDLETTQSFSSRKRKCTPSKDICIEKRILEIEEEKLNIARKKYNLKKEQMVAEEKWKIKHYDLEERKLIFEERKVKLQEKKFEYLLNNKNI